MTGPLKIYPTAEQCQINNRIECPERGCNQIFSSESNLNLHLTKTHKRTELERGAAEKHYFCPERACSWSALKHFKSMKLLRQHYLKVHAARAFECPSCRKKFPSAPLMKAHLEFCGLSFTCGDCTASYACYDTLKTHGRRKKHAVPEKSTFKAKVLGERGSSSVRDSHTLPGKRALASKMTQNSQQTQTGCKSVQLSVETQTVGEFFGLWRRSDADDAIGQKSAVTQTEVVKSCESGCNTSFRLEDFEFTMRDTQKNSSATQTVDEDDIYSISTTARDSIHTDTSDLLGDSLSNFFNCHTETQTDFMLGDDLFNCDYYSNMYTQTCDEILSGLTGFNDTHTQTAFDDVLRSVQSQTSMSTADTAGFKGVAHTETQTDAEFRQMLEIINS
ncbi:uncharacterized protein LOC132707409 [Cylas formicarius]|uniref:uncharacterized protein LOC132707409 n=1 Tax=Cylas formicarius TaxID=197179 RepID=UPI002958BFAF|nr:uncharacterized protein LOC132707409 [Cylas formicarius]